MKYILRAKIAVDKEADATARCTKNGHHNLYICVDIGVCHKMHK
jgi:hypothetical protein